MFGIADMIAHLEIGAALARKAAAATRDADKTAEKLQLMSRIFASEVAQLVQQNIMTILKGTGTFDQNIVSDFITSTHMNDLTESYQGLVSAMDRVADIIFER
jgi:alkylation response protein AidB-like acyl-CoA dehydrogenase